MLTDKHISNFQEIYFQEFGEKISKEEALEQGTKLLQLVRTVYQPMTEEDYEKIEAQAQNY